MSNIEDLVIDYVKTNFPIDATGHDWLHIERVHKMALYLQSKEGGDRLVVSLAALLHDVSDHKFNGGKLNHGSSVTYELLTEYGANQNLIDKVCSIVDKVSYKGANVDDAVDSIEGKIVQDADRLDAIGAIGIARTFAYGGFKNQPIHKPGLEPILHETFEHYASSEGTTINHFYEKLLLLEGRLKTATAREIGKKRTKLMNQFLEDFYTEWNFTE